MGVAAMVERFPHHHALRGLRACHTEELGDVGRTSSKLRH